MASLFLWVCYVLTYILTGYSSSNHVDGYYLLFVH